MIFKDLLTNYTRLFNSPTHAHTVLTNLESNSDCYMVKDSPNIFIQHLSYSKEFKIKINNLIKILYLSSLYSLNDEIDLALTHEIEAQQYLDNACKFLCIINSKSKTDDNENIFAIINEFGDQFFGIFLNRIALFSQVENNDGDIEFLKEKFNIINVVVDDLEKDLAGFINRKEIGAFKNEFESKLPNLKRCKSILSLTMGVIEIAEVYKSKLNDNDKKLLIKLIQKIEKKCLVLIDKKDDPINSLIELNDFLKKLNDKDLEKALNSQIKLFLDNIKKQNDFKGLITVLNSAVTELNNKNSFKMKDRNEGEKGLINTNIETLQLILENYKYNFSNLLNQLYTRFSTFYLFKDKEPYCDIEYIKVEFNKFKFETSYQKNFVQYGIGNQYDKWLALPKLDDDKLVPPIIIDGANFSNDLNGIEDYYLARLDSDDPRCAYLGKLTDCCQYMGGAGHACVIYGITKAESGFYAFFLKQDKVSINLMEDKIVAQSFVFNVDSSTLVFDNIEALPDYRFNQYITFLLKKAVVKLYEDHGFEKITMGLYNTKCHISDIPNKKNPLEYPNGFDVGAHLDSGKQCILYQSNRPETKYQLMNGAELSKILKSKFDLNSVLYYEIDEVNDKLCLLPYRFLSQVIKSGDVTVIEDCLSRNCFVSLSDIIIATKYNQLEIFKKIFNKQVEDILTLNNISFYDFYNYLINISIKHNKTEIFEYLVKESIKKFNLDLNRDNLEDYLALASKQSNILMVEKIFDSYNVKIDNHARALFVNKCNLLFEAIENFNTELIHYYISLDPVIAFSTKYTDVNNQDVNDLSLLLHAIDVGNEEALEILFKYNYQVSNEELGEIKRNIYMELSFSEQLILLKNNIYFPIHIPIYNTDSIFVSKNQYLEEVYDFVKNIHNLILSNQLDIQKFYKINFNLLQFLVNVNSHDIKNIDSSEKVFFKVLNETPQEFLAYRYNGVDIVDVNASLKNSKNILDQLFLYHKSLYSPMKLIIKSKLNNNFFDLIDYNNIDKLYLIIKHFNDEFLIAQPTNIENENYFAILKSCMVFNDERLLLSWLVDPKYKYVSLNNYELNLSFLSFETFENNDCLKIMISKGISIEPNLFVKLIESNMLRIEDGPFVFNMQNILIHLLQNNNSRFFDIVGLSKIDQYLNDKEFKNILFDFFQRNPGLNLNLIEGLKFDVNIIIEHYAITVNIIPTCLFDYLIDYLNESSDSFGYSEKIIEDIILKKYYRDVLDQLYHNSDYNINCLLKKSYKGIGLKILIDSLCVKDFKAMSIQNFGNILSICFKSQDENFSKRIVDFVKSANLTGDKFRYYENFKYQKGLISALSRLEIYKSCIDFNLIDEIISNKIKFNYSDLFSENNNEFSPVEYLLNSKNPFMSDVQIKRLLKIFVEYILYKYSPGNAVSLISNNILRPVLQKNRFDLIESVECIKYVKEILKDDKTLPLITSIYYNLEFIEDIKQLFQKVDDSERNIKLRLEYQDKLVRRPMLEFIKIKLNDGNVSNLSQFLYFLNQISIPVDNDLLNDVARYLQKTNISVFSKINFNKIIPLFYANEKPMVILMLLTRLQSASLLNIVGKDFVNCYIDYIKSDEQFCFSKWIKIETFLLNSNLVDLEVKIYFASTYKSLNYFNRPKSTDLDFDSFYNFFKSVSMVLKNSEENNNELKSLNIENEDENYFKHGVFHLDRILNNVLGSKSFINKNDQLRLMIYKDLSELISVDSFCLFKIGFKNFSSFLNEDNILNLIKLVNLKDNSECFIVLLNYLLKNGYPKENIVTMLLSKLDGNNPLNPNCLLTLMEYEIDGSLFKDEISRKILKSNFIEEILSKSSKLLSDLIDEERNEFNLDGERSKISYQLYIKEVPPLINLVGKYINNEIVSGRLLRIDNLSCLFEHLNYIKSNLEKKAKVYYSRIYIFEYINSYSNLIKLTVENYLHFLNNQASLILESKQNSEYDPDRINELYITFEYLLTIKNVMLKLGCDEKLIEEFGGNESKLKSLYLNEESKEDYPSEKGKKPVTFSHELSPVLGSNSATKRIKSNGEDSGPRPKKNK